MDFQWIAIALGDVAWIGVAFALGMAVRTIGLPPLVGFIAAGFVLSTQVVDPDGSFQSMLSKLSELGITLLLFTIGLKLNLRSLIKPEVWAVTLLHMAVTVAIATAGLTLIGIFWSRIGELDLRQLALIAFALSFSSTVFVAKTLEARGEVASRHGRIAIGILITQDIIAVAFLAAATGQQPSAWALVALPLLLILRPVLGALLKRVGHGELLVLLGFLLALGGAEVFQLVGLKGDLGALAIGALIAGSNKAEELAKTMLGFKDLFLLGFFLSIGMSGTVTWEAGMLALMITPLIVCKSALYFGLLLVFRQRARTALLAAFNLTNLSEFGLIVVALSVKLEWLRPDWLVILALALSFSFAVASALSLIANRLYSRYRHGWRRWQRSGVDQLHNLNLGDANIAVVGMGGIGSGTYDRLAETGEHVVVGIEIDPATVANQNQLGRHVLHGDPTDADFWDRLQSDHTLKMIIIALPLVASTKAVIAQLKANQFDGDIVASSRFADDETVLVSAGADHVFNTYAEAGIGLAVFAEEASQNDSVHSVDATRDRNLA